MAFDKLFHFMTKPWVVLLYFGFIAGLILCCDRPFTDYFFNLDLRAHLPFLSLVTRLGLSIFYFPTFLFLVLFFRFIFTHRQWEARAVFMLLSLVIPAVICTLLKSTLGRARPNLLIYENVYGFYGFKWDAEYWSCPSGHTTTIFSVMLALSVLFPRYFVGFFLTGVFVALSRVFLTHHYLSDVMISFYLVLLEIGCLVYVLRKKDWLIPVWRR